MVAEANPTAEKPLCRASGKDNQGKVPKNIQKSEREKLKRGCLNELFIELDETLVPSQQSNGKASILSSATRLITDLLLQVESLRKENAVLLSEEKYVRMERDELKEETIELAAAIGKLQDDLRTKCDTVWENGSGISGVIPLSQNLHPYQDSSAEAAGIPLVTRPQARYPNGSDSWPGQIFSDLQVCQDESRRSPSTTLTLL